MKMVIFNSTNSHSFGFECTKRSNLHMLDELHLIFAAGNVAEIVNIDTKCQIYIPSISGGGIGAVAVSILIT